MSQYPASFNPPHRGRCDHKTGGKECGYETRAYDPRWLDRCPAHWQELLRQRRGKP